MKVKAFQAVDSTNYYLGQGDRKGRPIIPVSVIQPRIIGGIMESKDIYSFVSHVCYVL